MNAPFGRDGRWKGRAGQRARPAEMNQRVVFWVMALPQRGHWAVLPAQVVPQEEQVEQPVQLCPRLFTQVPLYMVQLQEAAEEPFEELAAEVFSAAQADCGNSGSEKNSSQTFSANSSQGGIGQKP